MISTISSGSSSQSPGSAPSGIQASGLMTEDAGSNQAASSASQYQGDQISQTNKGNNSSSQAV